jgi:capsular exopolysaccharide synthesis family protein
MLRTRVLQRMRRNGWKTIAVTGTRPGEGKTLTAINLSISLARDIGTTVMLVDMDLRKPSIHRYLGISPRYGIGDFLRGSVSLGEAAVQPGLDRLGVLLNDRPFQNSSEMLTSPQAAHLVEQAKDGNDRIAVFDLPPILASDDMLAFCPLVDAVLLVLAHGITRQADMVAARDLLQNVNVVGAVLNQSSEEVAPYYYYGSR